MEPMTNVAGAVFGQVPSTAEEACGPRPADAGSAISTLMPDKERQAREQRLRAWEACSASFEAKRVASDCGPQPVFPSAKKFEEMFFADQMALVKAGNDWKACIEGKAKASSPDQPPAPAPAEEQGKPAHCRVPFFRLQQMSSGARAAFEDQCKGESRPISEMEERCGMQPIVLATLEAAGIDGETMEGIRRATEGWYACIQTYALTLAERQALEEGKDAVALVERERQRVCGRRPRPGAYGQLSAVQYFEDTAAWRSCLGAPGEKPTKEGTDECATSEKAAALSPEERQAREKLCNREFTATNPYR